MRKILFALSLLFSLSVLAREMQSLDKGWQFVQSDASIDEISQIEGWRIVDVPHDWSIEGEFDRSNPTGQGGAYLTAGIGWYKKTINTDFKPGPLVSD